MHIRNFIEEKLVELYKTVSTDGYGQVHKSYLRPSVFAPRIDEVQEYAKETGILQFSTYGGRFGSYTAFTVESPDLREVCREALRKNPSYIEAMTSW